VWISIVVEFGGVIMTALLTAMLVKCCVDRQYGKQNSEPVTSDLKEEPPEKISEEVQTCELTTTDASTQTSASLGLYRPRIYEYSGGISSAYKKKFLNEDTKL